MCAPCSLAGIQDQLEGDPQGQVIREEDDQDEEDDLEGRHDLGERDELLESDGPEEQDQLVEQYSNSNAAASDAFEEDPSGLRPRTEGGGDSEEDLDTAVEESSSRLNRAQSDLVVSSRSSECRTCVFILAVVELYMAVLLSCAVDRPC